MSEIILRFNDLRKKIGLSRSTVWRLSKSGRFPRAIQLGAASVGWKLSEIEAWIESRTEAI